MREAPKPYRGFHPEFIKAAIKMKYGTIRQFHEVNGLPRTGLFDFLRGRASATVQQAIDKVLSEQSVNSINVDSSSHESGFHRLNAGAK